MTIQAGAIQSTSKKFKFINRQSFSQDVSVLKFARAILNVNIIGSDLVSRIVDVNLNVFGISMKNRI